MRRLTPGDARSSAPVAAAERDAAPGAPGLVVVWDDERGLVGEPAWEISGIGTLFLSGGLITPASWSSSFLTVLSSSPCADIWG